LIALVSGSTRGIGKAIAQQLVLDGYVVIQNSRSLITSEELIGEKHVIADVTNEDECNDLVTEVIKDYGQIDLLVCNVGSGRNLHKDASPSNSWNHFLNTNLNSMAYLVNSALPSLSQKQGSVIAISSICAEDPTIDAPIGYTTAKAGLNIFMRAMAVKHGKKGLRFNVIAPGNVYFPGSTWDQKLKDNKLAVEAYLEQKVPLGRFVEPQDIALAVSFLAGPKARNITGVVLSVDGGQSL
jgi:3-oxoacyl-[acyl-carrier protein] reductase